MAELKADQIAANITRSQWNDYLKNFAPVEKQLLGTLNSTQMVSDASTSAQAQNRVAADVLARTQDRYGMQGAPGALQSRLARQEAMGAASNYAQAVNTARLDQRDRNTSMAASLIQQGRGVANQAIQGLGEAATAEAQRKTANAQMQSAYDNAMISADATRQAAEIQAEASMNAANTQAAATKSAAKKTSTASLVGTVGSIAAAAIFGL